MILVPYCERFQPFSRDANTSEDSLDKLRSLIKSFRFCWSNSTGVEEHAKVFVIINISKFFVIMLLLVWTFINEEIRQLIKLRNRNIRTMSYWSNWWWKTFVTQKFALLFIYLCHIYRTEVTVVNMICRLPPNQWYTKTHWPSGSTCPLSQTFYTLCKHYEEPMICLGLLALFQDMLNTLFIQSLL